MTVTSRPYFGQDGVLSIETAAGTSIDIGIVQNWKASIEFETSDLYGIGSVWRQGAARYNGKVSVSCEFCAISDAIKDSVIPYIINPSFTPSTSTTSVSSTDTGADSTALARFTLKGTFTAEDGTHQKTITVGDVYFSNFPWEAATGEWIKVNLEGTGSTYTIEDGS